MNYYYSSFQGSVEHDSEEEDISGLASPTLSPRSHHPHSYNPYYYQQQQQPLTKDRLAKKDQLDELLLAQQDDCYYDGCYERKLNRRRSISNGNIARHLYNEDNSRMPSIDISPLQRLDSEDSEASVHDQSNNTYDDEVKSIIKNYGSIPLQSSHSRSANASSVTGADWSLYHHHDSSDRWPTRRFSGLVRLSAAHIAFARTQQNNRKRHYSNSTCYALFLRLAAMAARVVNSRAVEPLDTRMSVDELISLSRYLDFLKSNEDDSRQSDGSDEDGTITAVKSTRQQQRKLAEDPIIVVEDGDTILHAPTTVAEEEEEEEEEEVSDTKRRRRRRRHISSLGNIFPFAPIDRLPSISRSVSETSSCHNHTAINDDDENEPLLKSTKATITTIATTIATTKRWKDIKYYVRRFCRKYLFFSNNNPRRFTEEHSNTQIRFEGWSLFLFSPTSLIRLYLWKIVGSRWFEIFIFALLISQWTLLSFIPNLFNAENKMLLRIGDYFLCFINIIYTFELVSKIIIYGFILNTHSNTKPSLKAWVRRKRRSSFLLLHSEDLESDMSTTASLGDADNDTNHDDTATMHSDYHTQPKLPAFAHPQRIHHRASMSSGASSTSHSPKATTMGRRTSYQQRHQQRNSFSGSSDLLSDNSSPIANNIHDTLGVPIRRNGVHEASNNNNNNNNEDARSMLTTAEQQVLATLTLHAAEDESTDFLKINHRSFLSSLANVMDLISVVSYWTCLISVFGTGRRPWSIFQSLAAVRLLRLLVITEGTSVIMTSLNSSYDMLKNVMGFFVFLWLLFSLTALFIFTNAFSRRCAVMTVEDGLSYVEPRLSCSGYYSQSGDRVGPLDINTGLQYANHGGDGQFCPRGQICIQDVANQPEHGYMSYQNIFSTMLNVLTVISTENWTDLLYISQDSVSRVGAAVFYVVCIYLMTFVMVPMFIAVITTSFSHVRGDMRESAFSSQRKAGCWISKHRQDSEGGGGEWIYEEMGLANGLERTRSRVKGWIHFIVHQAWFQYIGSLVVVMDLVMMSFYHSKLLIHEKEQLDFVGRIFTCVFAVEIILRIYGSLDWNQFWSRIRNRVDLVIAVLTLIDEWPSMKESKYHVYLLIFAVLRSYRVAYLFPGVLQLLSDAVGDGQGILNLTFFTFLVLFLLAPISVQLFGGDFKFVDEPSMRFDNSYQAFLALFQIMTGENWTDILYDAMHSQKSSSVSYAAIFMIFLYFTVHYMVLNLFIAVIMENFDLDEEEIKQIQIKKYIREHRWKPEYFKMDRISRFLLPLFIVQDEKKLDFKNIPQNLVAHVTSSRFKEFLGEIVHGEDTVWGAHHTTSALHQNLAYFALHNQDPCLSRVRRSSSITTQVTGLSSRRNSTISQYSNRSLRIDNRLPSYGATTYHYEEEPLVKYGDEYELNVARENKAVVVENLNVFRSMFILKNDHIIRKVCSRLVSLKSYNWFIIGLIGISTLLAMWADTFNRQKHPVIIDHVFIPLHLIFLLIYWLDIAVHMIVDGVCMLPKSYMRNTWNLLDIINLLCQTCLTILSIFGDSSLQTTTNYASYIRILSTLRSVRIVYYVDGMRVIFLDLIYGLPKMIDAVALNMLVFVPFAIYGCFLFSGRFSLCNDGTALSRQACFGEFRSEDDENLGILLPRVWKNPYDYSFDTFGKSILHLFECASGEGWILSLFSAMSVVPEDRDAQPQFSWSSSSIFHSIYYVVFMFVASLCSIQLFIGVFLEIFKQRNGISSLTNTQRQFQDLQRQLELVKPSLKAKRPPDGTLRATFYDLITDKRGRFDHFMATVLMANIVVFMTEHMHQPEWLSHVQNALNLICLSLYVFEMAAKIAGLGFYKWASVLWNIYDFVLVGLAIVTFIPRIFMDVLPFGWDMTRKLVLVGIAFRLAQRNESLDTLFRSVKRAFPSIFFVSFVFGIVMICFGVIFQEQFSFTRYGPYGNEHANFRSLFNTLLTLFRITTGENWDFLMHDFTILPPECSGKGDCGSPKYAIILFISFYVVCTFIFVNLVTVIVIDNFSFTFDKRNQFTLITRTDLRNFKLAWSSVDPKATGYINIHQVPKFLSLLEGVLAVNIYEKEHSLSTLLEASNQVDADVSHLIAVPLSNAKTSTNSNKNAIGERFFNLHELNRRLANIDPQTIKDRQRQYTEVYQEIINSASHRGVAFHNMLEILAIRLVDVSKSLTFNELVNRARIQDKVAKELAKERAKGLVAMLILRRKYLKRRQSARINQALTHHKNSNSLSLVGNWLMPNKNSNHKLSSSIRSASTSPNHSYLQLGTSLSKSSKGSNAHRNSIPNKRGGSPRSIDSTGVPKIVVDQAHQQTADNAMDANDDGLQVQQHYALLLPDRFATQNTISPLQRRNSASVIVPTTLGAVAIRRRTSVSQPVSPASSSASSSNSIMSSPRLIAHRRASILSFRRLSLMTSESRNAVLKAAVDHNLSDQQEDHLFINTDCEDVFTQYYAVDESMDNMSNLDAEKIVHKFEHNRWSDLLETTVCSSDEEDFES